jgi:hypothetical protein
MKKLFSLKTIFILLCLMSSAATSNAQYIKFTSYNNATNKISIPENEVWQFVTALIPDGAAFKTGPATNQPLGGIPATHGNWRSTESASSASGGEYSYAALGSFFVGPYEIWPDWNVAGSTPIYCLVFKKVTSVTNNAGSSPTSVVIPTSASGDVDVKLEQSADNVTWTECLPGTYNSSTVKRFFRLRAVEK